MGLAAKLGNHDSYRGYGIQDVSKTSQGDPESFKPSQSILFPAWMFILVGLRLAEMGHFHELVRALMTPTAEPRFHGSHS